MKTLSSLLVAVAAQCGFAQLNLTDAEKLARERNPLIPAAMARLSAARADARQLQAPYKPQISLNGIAARGDGSMMFSPEAGGRGFESAPREGILAADAMLEWTVFSWGREASLRRVGTRTIEAARAEAEMTVLDVLHELRIEFAMGLRLQSVVEGLKTQVASAQELERITNARYDEGKVPQAYVFRAKADRLRAERQLAVAEADLLAALAGVAVCCGADITGGRLGEWDIPLDVPKTFDDALNFALEHSPDIAKLKSEAAVMGFREEAAKRSALPQLSLNAMGDFLSREVAGSSRGTNAAAVLTFPLYDGGLRKSEIAQARARRLDLEAQLQAKINEVRREVVTHWAQWIAAEKVVESALAEKEAGSEAYRIAKIRYEEGKSIQVEVSQALADLQASMIAEAEAWEYKRTAWTHLMRAIGK
jgi:outer membrane protein